MAKVLTNFSCAEGVRENVTVVVVTLPGAYGYVFMRAKGGEGFGCGVNDTGNMLFHKELRVVAGAGQACTLTTTRRSR